MRCLQPLWCMNTITLETRVQLLNSIVIPVATYASETLKMTAITIHHLNTFQQRCLRRILKITYQDWVTNEEVHRRTSTCLLAQIVVLQCGLPNRFSESCQPGSCEWPCFGTRSKEEESKDAPRSRGEGHSVRTSEASTSLGTKPQPSSRSSTMEIACRPMRRTAREDLSPK